MNIGVLGGGQLGRMLALAGYPLTLNFRFYDPSPMATAGIIAESVTGEYDDFESLESFLEGLDVVTYEFENVSLKAVDFIQQRMDVFPPIQALEVAQDRLNEKNFFTKLGIPIAPFAQVDSFADLKKAIKKIGLPGILKTRRFGYDGKGQWFLQTPEDVENLKEATSLKWMIYEGYVDFYEELSLLSVRSKSGETAFYPLIENEHHEGILQVSFSPTSFSDHIRQKEAEEYAKKVLEELDYVGVLAIEFFVTIDEMLANEMAPRVHNSGHLTIEGSDTSQFENHLRAIIGLPLGSTKFRNWCTMYNIIGDLPDCEAILQVPGAHLHLYDKAPAPNRKIGHVTICGYDDEDMYNRIDILKQKAMS